jgi:hypothetical protein
MTDAVRVPLKWKQLLESIEPATKTAPVTKVFVTLQPRARVPEAIEVSGYTIAPDAVVLKDLLQDPDFTAAWNDGSCCLVDGRAAVLIGDYFLVIPEPA